MIDHYNAFISYKHAPLDTKIAERVQSKLEHFHIPRKIRKKTGMKRIQRIFRDKDELPITSNLTETIEHALENSDFLIVICTHNTKESVWVKREIQFFLKTHSRNKILAVLGEGEPSEVLPVELLQEEVQMVNPDGSTYVSFRDKEPLCCDYRMPFRKADKLELPRLASPIIGCSYDELMNRRRTYQMQRITALAMVFITLALGFIGYMITKQFQLKKSYQATLRNQSIYLANESQALLAKENRIEAIQLALAALPNGDDDRPVTSEAVRALTSATLAYTPLSGTSVHSVWNYKAPSTIREMKVSPNNKVLSVVDSAMKVTSWDTETHEVIFEKSFAGQSSVFIDYLDDEKLLITSGREVSVFELRTHENLWSYSLEEKVHSSGPMPGKERKWVLVPTTRDILYQISLEDGKLLNEYKLPTDYDFSFQNYQNYILSPDETKVAVICLDYGNGFQMGVFDLQEGSIKFFQSESTDLRDFIWTDNNTIVIAGYNILDVTVLNGASTIIQPHTDKIYCVDASTMTEKWIRDFSYNVYDYDSELLNLPTRNAVAYATGDLMEVYSVDTGETLGSYETQQIIIDIHDNDNDGNPVYVTSSGSIGTSVESIGPNTSAYYSYFVDNIQDVAYGDGFYILQNDSNQVIYYKFYVSDDDWKEIDESIEVRGISEHYLDDDYLVVKTYQNSNPHLVVYDARNMKLLFETDIEGTDYGACNLLGVYNDKLYVSVHDTEGKLTAYRISMTNGEVEEKIQLADSVFTPALDCSMTGEYLTYLVYEISRKSCKVNLFNLATGDTESFLLPVDEIYPADAPVYYPESKMICYIDKSDNYLIDVENHKVRDIDLPKDWTGTELVKSDSKGERWIVADKSKLLIYDAYGKQLSELMTGGMSAIGAAFYKEGTSNEQILVVFDDGSFYRYDASSGEFIGKSEVEAYFNQGIHADLEIDEEKGLLFIHSGEITDIVDLNTWIEVAVVWNSLGYYAPTDRFFAFGHTSTKDFRIGYFEHYTIDDLIRKAEDIIKGAELTDEQKSRYGIN